MRLNLSCKLFGAILFLMPSMFALNKTGYTNTRPIVATPAMLHNKIIFIRDSDVWMIDPKTRREQMILKNPFWDASYWGHYEDIDFSPDLTHVAFTHELKDPTGQGFTGNELYIMSLKRTGKIRLTHTHAELNSYDPQFSPDGQKIVYTQRTGFRSGGPGYTGIEIRMVNSDGTNDHRVIGNIDDLGQSYFGASWSRDGKRLLFTHYIGNIDYSDEGYNSQELQTCAIDGSDVRNFNGNYSKFLRPDVSANGKWRAVIEPINPKVCYINELRFFTSKGKFVQELTASYPALDESNPQWNPEGKRIAFLGEQEYTDADKNGSAHIINQSGIWTIGVYDHKLRRLTTNVSAIVAWLS